MYPLTTMNQYINDNFARSTHTVSVRTSVSRQMLPIKKLNIRNTEWSFCGSFERGEITIALVLDYCQPQIQGIWAGLHGEVMNRNGFLMSRMTKMYFIRPGQNLHLHMRLLPETYYKRRLSGGRDHLPKGCIYVRVTSTFASGISRLQLESFLSSNNTVLQTILWPVIAQRTATKEPDMVLAFGNGMKLLMHKATILGKLDLLSPIHQWNKSFPTSKTFHADVSEAIQDNSILLFYELICTNYVPWKKMDSALLHDLLILAKYFNYDFLMRLCGVQLIHMLREELLTTNSIFRLTLLQMPFITGIINCHEVTTTVEPEVGNLNAKAKNDV